MSPVIKRSKMGVSKLRAAIPSVLALIATGLGNHAYGQSPYVIDPGQLDHADVECNEVCDYVLSQIGGEWNNQRNQWCANHGHQTSFLSAAQNLELRDDDPETPGIQGEAAECAYPIYAGKYEEGLDDGLTCSDVTALFQSCQFKTSNLAAQCSALETINTAATGSANVLVADIVAAGICGAECFGNPVSAIGLSTPLVSACGLAGTAAGVIEWQSHKEIQDFAGGFFTDFGRHGSRIATGAALVNGAGWVIEKGAHSGSTARKSACVAAAYFGVMAGLRGTSMTTHAIAKKKTCDNVSKLHSDVVVAGNNGSSGGGSSNGGNGFTSPWGNGSNGGTSGTGTGGFTNPWQQIASEGLFNEGQEELATADMTALKNSGLYDWMKNNSSKLPVDEIAKHLQNGDLGAAYGSMLGNSPAAAKLGELSLAASKDADRLASLLPNGGKLMAGSRDGGSTYTSKGGSSRADSAKGFSVFGNSGADRSLAATTDGGTQEKAFKGAEDPNDIWHRGTNRSLFEIVSGRIESVSPRLSEGKKSLPISF